MSKLNKSKKIILLLTILSAVMLVTGGTLGYYSWKSSEDQKTTVTFTAEKGFSCKADAGGGISSDGVKLIPTTIPSNVPSNLNTTKYIRRKIQVMPNISVNGVKVYLDLWLTINSISSGLSNSNNFKYALTTNSSSSTTGVVTAGNFKGKTVNDKILLLKLKKYESTTTDSYYLWIWLDEAETSTSTMNQSFNFSIGGSCTDKELTGAEMLIKNANSANTLYADGTKTEMYTFNHTNSNKTDYRYIGNNPNNYIEFNGETWRIIGVFDGHIKIMKDTPLEGSYSYDYKKNGVGSSTSGYGSNDWTDSQLMYMLNPTTYKLKPGYTTDGTYIKDNNDNIIYKIGTKPAAIAASDTSYNGEINNWQLNSTAKSHISETTYYLG